ncbi:phosphoglycerate kinase, cytosolic-like isoform X2 [Cynara cardunculus var. scolymus]|uniref:phosphoglycerate kinase, cytosolic-like isoform X2 n=1 Tax=Cynara cardunculus var. scolymus TaxID=59895 RepID=UPI000D6286F5|nr:phosphoglycerate kinase, cytosolic-like isoform X2 [Cynara cardunculus var. scolymus]
MSRILDMHHCRPTPSLMFFTCKSQDSSGNYVKLKKKGTVTSSIQANSSEVGLGHRTDRGSLSHKVKEDDVKAFDALPHDQQAKVFISALSTIKYLHEAGAKVILMSSWSVKTNSKLLSAESVSAYLSSILKLRAIPMKSFPGYEQPTMEDSLKPSIYLLKNLSQFKEDLANNSRFSEELCSGVDIFVNDAFFQSHKVLASTVGVTSFCYTSVAGFQFEEGLIQLEKAFVTKRSPYIAMVGGGNLVEKSAAVHYLVSSCDGLVFVGNMSFQIMHALGLPVPKKLVEVGAFNEAIRIIRIANSRNIPILFPKDFWCLNDHLKKPQLVPTHCLFEGWSPVGLGPNSLEEITALLSKSKKIVWIGPVKFGLSIQDSYGTSILAKLFGKLSQGNCDVTVVGNMACKALMEETSVSSGCNVIENASIVWEFLKGRNLPGLMALDRGYPYSIDWHAIFDDPARPLLVDIGSGNGLFLFGMVRKMKDMNFLGLEMNGKLVKRCLETVRQSGLKNGYFIETNATSTFRSIVSGYPGELVLASIQCPNPDFNRPEHRWKMVQRSLIEAIRDLLSLDGKVFLQSDIEAVALRMKQQFLKYGNGKFTIDHQEEWLKENPFGVESDWEQHVLHRGLPMYRLMLSKSLR